MPEIEQSDFGLEAMDQPQLLLRFQTLRASIMGKADDEISDETLKEMVAICQILRRKSGGPPKVSKAGKNLVPTLDSL